MSSLTQRRLREVLYYNPEFGSFHYRTAHGNVKAWGRAGSRTAEGYLKVYVDGTPYKAHRLAFLYMRGSWPYNVVDHRDGDRENNAWENLRDVTHSVNMQNQRRARADNRVGLLGVSPNGARFRACVWAGGSQINAGTFDTPQEAHEAYLRLKEVVHPSSRA